MSSRARSFRRAGRFQSCRKRPVAGPGDQPECQWSWENNEKQRRLCSDFEIRIFAPTDHFSLITNHFEHQRLTAMESGEAPELGEPSVSEWIAVLRLV